jgi:hypothetical protein
MSRLFSGSAAQGRLILTILLLAAVCRASEKAERLLAIMPSGESFRQAFDGMKSDLGNRYEWKTFDPDAKNAEDSLARLCSAYAPRALVLMDTRAVALAKRMQARDSALDAMPKFVLMTLKVEDAAKGLHHAVGVRFEVPAYAVFTQLRALSGRDFTRIGVFYRRSFSAFVEDSRRLLAREKLELIGKCIDCDGGGSPAGDEIVKSLGKGMDAFKEAGVQVVWMLPDNALVNPATLGRFWVPRLRRGKMPLVVPLANLASKQADLGLFSAYPDYPQLGVQAAQQVVQVLEEDVPPAALGFEPLISVQTTLNLSVAERLHWEIRKELLGRVGELVKP